MKILFLTIFSFLILSSINVLFAQENHYAIGLDNIPFSSPNSVEFRNWVNEEKGFRIILDRSSNYLFSYIGYGEDKNINETGLLLNLVNMEFAFLNRQKSSIANGLFIYKGIGLSISTPYYSGSQFYGDGYRIDLALHLQIPFGIEYFFLKSLPNISCVIDADFFTGINYHRVNNSNSKQNSIYLDFGVNPRLFLNCYFK